LDRVRELRNHPLFIERNDLHLWVRKVFGYESTARAKRIVGIRNSELDLLDANLQDVSRFGAFNIARPRENVPARSFVGDFFCYVAERLLDLIGKDSGSFEAAWSRGD